MNRYTTMENPEEAVEALFGAFKEEAFAPGWESAVLDAAPSAPVIRLDAAGAAASIPAPPREVAHPTVWERHRLTVARTAAAVAFLIGLGGLLSLLPDDEVNAVGDQEIAAAVSTTSSPTPTTVSAPLIADGQDIQPTIHGPTVTTLVATDETASPTNAAPTTATPTTVPPTAPSTTIPPTKPAPTSSAPVTTIPTTTPTTAPVSTTEAPPTTAVTTAPTVPSTVPTTIVTSTTVVTTTPPEPIDVRIRRLAVSKITSTSAFVSFTTNDCAVASIQVDGGLRSLAGGFPVVEDCRTLHFTRLGAEAFSDGLNPGTFYRVRITTVGQDGSTASATITFTTLKQ